MWTGLGKRWSPFSPWSAMDYSTSWIVHKGLALVLVSICCWIIRAFITSTSWVFAALSRYSKTFSGVSRVSFLPNTWKTFFYRGKKRFCSISFITFSPAGHLLLQLHLCQSPSLFEPLYAPREEVVVEAMFAEEQSILKKQMSIVIDYTIDTSMG